MIAITPTFKKASKHNEPRNIEFYYEPCVSPSYPVQHGSLGTNVPMRKLVLIKHITTGFIVLKNCKVRPFSDNLCVFSAHRQNLFYSPRSTGRLLTIMHGVTMVSHILALVWIPLSPKRQMLETDVSLRVVCLELRQDVLTCSKSRLKNCLFDV